MEARSSPENSGLSAKNPVAVLNGIPPDCKSLSDSLDTLGNIISCSTSKCWRVWSHQEYAL